MEWRRLGEWGTKKDQIRWLGGGRGASTAATGQDRTGHDWSASVIKSGLTSDDRTTGVGTIHGESFDDDDDDETFLPLYRGRFIYYYYFLSIYPPRSKAKRGGSMLLVGLLLHQRWLQRKLYP